MTKTTPFSVRDPLVRGTVCSPRQLHPAAQGRGGAPVTLPDGAGKDLVQTTCSKCHGLGLMTNGFGYTRADWEKVVGSMVALPQPDRDAVLGVSRDATFRRRTGRSR